MTGPSGKRLSICSLRFRIASPKIYIDLGWLQSTETLGEAILNLSGQIDLLITLEISDYLFTSFNYFYTIFNYSYDRVVLHIVEKTSFFMYKVGGVYIL